MTSDALQPILDAIGGRRADVADLGAELRQRIDELGPVLLDSPGRQAAFQEVLDAITPPGFDVFPLPDHCQIDPAGHSIVFMGAVVDQARGQVVGMIKRELTLDSATVKHAFLEVQRPYRGGGLAVLLLQRSFKFYDDAGIRYVRVHAALETGRWYWARLGFDFATPGDQGLVAGWGTLALMALGQPPLPPDSPARRWAQMGTGEPPVRVSLDELHTKIDGLVTAALTDAGSRPQFEALDQHYSARFEGGWIDRARFEAIAENNGFSMTAEIPLGRAIMLTGPDWHGVFDLENRGARDAFEEELNRALKKSTQAP